MTSLQSLIKWDLCPCYRMAAGQYLTCLDLVHRLRKHHKYSTYQIKRTLKMGHTPPASDTQILKYMQLEAPRLRPESTKQSRYSSMLINR